jgi:hypothetical protein
MLFRGFKKAADAGLSVRRRFKHYFCESDRSSLKYVNLKGLHIKNSRNPKIKYQLKAFNHVTEI